MQSFIHLVLFGFAAFLLQGCQGQPYRFDAPPPESRGLSSLHAQIEPTEEEGVYHLPLTRIQANGRNAGKGLVRRDSQSLKVDWDTFGVEVNFDDHGPYLYKLAFNDDLVVAYNKKDTNGYSPREDEHAHHNGPVAYNIYRRKAYQYQAEKFSFGPNILTDLGFLYSPPIVRNEPGEPEGSLGLGLPGSNIFKQSDGFAATSILSAVYEAKSWAKPIFSTRLRFTSEGGTAKLVLGSANSSTFWQDTSSKSRFQLPIKINGHEGEADISSFERAIIVPPRVARKMIKEAGLEPGEDESGAIVGRIPCKDRAQVPDLHIETDVATIVFDSDQSVLREDDGETCRYIVKGVKQGTYPVPFSLGLVFLSLVDVAFDFTPDHPRIGFNPI